MRIRPFITMDAGTVSAWASTPAEVEMWCSLQVCPVEPEVIEAWSADPDVNAFVLVDGEAADGERPVGYGEVWIDDSEAEAELARLIVDPKKRRRHLGRQLVVELTKIARTDYEDVVLRVRPENVIAQRCYERAGFIRASAADEAAWNAGQPYDYVWMAAGDRVERVKHTRQR